jgi:hypothetical protein
MKKKEDSVKMLLVEFEEGGYHLFVNLKVDGKKCRFLIDTGASKSVIDKSYFEKNFGQENLKTIQQETAGLHSSTPQSHYGKLKTLQVGKQIMKNFLIAAVDLSHVNQVYVKLKKPKIHGILGSDLMLNYKMLLDYGQLKIVLP